MAYLDYSPVVLPDHTEGVRQLGDALTEVMKRREQRRQFEETQVFQREQEQRRYQQQQMQYDYQNRIASAKEARDQRDFKMREDAVNQAKADRVRTAADPQIAQALAQGISVADPETGKELGRGSLQAGPMKDIGPEPSLRQEPGMPPEIAARFRGKRGGQMPEPEANAFVGPIPSADELRSSEVRRIAEEPDTAEVPDVEGRVGAAEAERQAQEATRKRYQTQFESYSQENPAPEMGPTAADAKYDQELDAFEGERAALPGKQQAYASARSQAEASRPYELQIPGQPAMRFDFQTQRHAASKDAADQFLASLQGVPMNDRDRAAAMQIAASIEGGTIKPEQAGVAFQRERMQGTGASDRTALQTQKDVAALERAKIPKPGLNIQVAKLGYEKERDRSRFLRTDLEKTLARNGAKDIGDAARETANLEKNLASGEPGTIRHGLMALWRLSQHDNRMSDKDAVLANNLDQSLLSRIQGWISTNEEGIPGDINLGAAQDTARRLRGYFVEKNQEMMRLYKEEFYDSGQYDQKEADVLGAQTFPGWKRLTDNQAAPVGRGTSGKRRPPELRSVKTVTKGVSPAADDEAMQ